MVQVHLVKYVLWAEVRCRCTWQCMCCVVWYGAGATGKAGVAGCGTVQLHLVMHVLRGVLRCRCT